MFNPWLFRHQFPVGSQVEILREGTLDVYQEKMVGKIGTVTNVDFFNEWVGVHIDGGPKWICNVRSSDEILFKRSQP
jgi:hypothetical protein